MLDNHHAVDVPGIPVPEYTPDEQAVLEAVFKRWERADVRYVVPRGYHNLPAKVPGGDVDVIVDAADFPDALDLCDSSGLGDEPATTRIGTLLERGIQNYHRVAELLLTNPRVLYDELETALGGSSTSQSVSVSYVEQKKHFRELILHLANHLAYRSPMNDRKVRVDPRVERQLHDRSRVEAGVRVPSPPDELAHLLCRGVFDNGGEFPSYYVDWCEELKGVVLGDKEYEAHLDELLSWLFFEADVVVKENLVAGAYEDIKGDLVAYAGY